LFSGDGRIVFYTVTPILLGKAEMRIMLYAAAGSAFLFAWAFISAVLLGVFNKPRPIEKLKYYDSDYEQKGAMKEKYGDSRGSRKSILKILAFLVPKRKSDAKRAKLLELELLRADLPVTPDELLIVKIISSSILSLLAFAAFRNIFAPLAVFALVWNVPRFIIKARKKERLKQFDSQLNEGITIISNSLKAGHSFLQAIAVVAEETSEPISKEFRRLLKEMSLGISEEDALKNMLERVESEDLRLMVNAVLIQKDIGGNLSEILNNISETIRERQKLKNELRTLTAQGKLSGGVLMIMPVALGVIIYLLNREYIMTLFTTTAGLVMVAMAILGELLGVVLIRRIINIEM